jgi:uncharacterized cupredoxin-like copper-binding protein
MKLRTSLLVVLAGLSTPVLAASTVDVTLDDMAGSTMPTDNGLGMGGDPKTAPMTVTATPGAVPAGSVTFDVKNASSDVVHEMLVVKVADTTTTLPYDEAAMKLDEAKLGSLGEVSELDPGKSGNVTLDLAPGTYALLCNQPGHYAAGMWTLLTVN